MRIALFAVLGIAVTILVSGPLWLATRVEDPWDFEIPASPREGEDPFALERLRVRLEGIAGEVEAVVGDAIDTSALRLVLGDAFESAEREARETHPSLYDPRGDDQDPVGQVVVGAELQGAFLAVLGRYRPEARTLEIYPWTFHVLEPADPEGLLDVVLAHELAHVWQHQQGMPFEGEGLSGTGEAELARAAVLEGGAEFISREVARRLGCTPMFELVAGKRAEVPAERGGSASQQARARWERWAYGEGLRFVEHVHARLGPGPAWMRLRTDPPTTVWDIEQPDAWLDGHAARVPDLDGWAERMLRVLQRRPPRFAWRPAWGHHPLLREDVRTRLADAGHVVSGLPWDAARGGMLVAGTAESGPLAGAPFVLRAYRFADAAAARLAQRRLEAAAARGGPATWTGAAVVAAQPADRVRRDLAGGVVRGVLLADEPPGPVYGAAWGLRAHGGLLFEMHCVRDGVEPLLLDLLRMAVLALDPAWDGEAPSLAPGAVAAIEALAPTTREEADEGTERGVPLLAALTHADDAVVRYALEALAEGRVRPSPWSAEALNEVVLHTRDDDPWIRSLAVRAARAQEYDELLSQDRRAALAQDGAAVVRRALEAPAGRGPDGTEALVRQIMARVQGDAPSEPTRRAVPKDTQEAASLQFDLMFADTDDPAWPSLQRHVRRTLVRGSRDVRMVLVALLGVSEKRVHFGPELVRALGEDVLRPFAASALARGGFELGVRGGETLQAYLDLPRCRVAALRALAVNDVAVSAGTLARAREWMDAAAPRLRTAAALLVLRLDPDDVRALPLLSEAWDERSADWRRQIRAAAMAHRPDAERTHGMQARALEAAVVEERGSYLKVMQERPYAPAHVAHVLAALERLGPRANTQLWAHLIDTLDDLPEQDRARASDQIAVALQRWCDHGTLPRVRPDVIDAFADPDLVGVSDRFVAAVDRCLQMGEPSLFTCGLLPLRRALDPDRHPEPPGVAAAIVRLASLQQPVPGLSAHHAPDVVHELADRSDVGPAAIESLIRARIEGRLGELIWTGLGELIADDPERIEAAVGMLPALLDADRADCVEMAVEILDEAGPRATRLLPALRRRAGRAVGVARGELQRVVEALEAALAGAPADGDD